MWVELRLSPENARKFVDALTLFRHRLFLGRLRAWCSWSRPGPVKHRYWGEGQNALVRLHIGLESTEDVIADLAQALDQAK